MSQDRDRSPPSSRSRERRGSVSQAAFQSLFQRSNSTSAGMNGVPSSTPGMTLDQRRRLSVTTLGLSGATPSGAFGGLRRGSVSTNSNSDSIDENAVEDDEYSRTAPTTPFTRRMSFGANAMLSMRAPSGSSPGTSDQGFNWSEQLRSRAENSVSGMSRTSFSMGSGGSPPRTGTMHHDRARSVSDMPAPPQQASAMKAKQPERPKPDHFQERILKGDFYMD